MVAVLFPEAGLVVRGERKTAHPFHAFPEIQVRHDQAQGIAMLGRQRFAIVLEGMGINARLMAPHVVAAARRERHVIEHPRDIVPN